MKSFTTATILVVSAVAANAACTPTKSDVCNSIGGGFLNLGLLGCSSIKVDPDIEIFRRSDESSEEFVARAEMERALTSAKKTDACKSLSSAGFVNLNLFGCGKFDVSPKVDIFRRDGSSGTTGHPGTKGSHGTKGTPGVAGSKGVPGKAGTAGTHGTNGAAGSHSSAGAAHPSGNGSHGTKGTPGVAGVPGKAGTAGTNGAAGSHGTKGTSDAPGSEDVHEKPVVTPATPVTPSTPSTQGTSEPLCRVPVHKDSCNDFSKAGLINLDLLGCFDLDVSPTIKVGQGLKNFWGF